MGPGPHRSCGPLGSPPNAHDPAQLPRLCSRFPILKIENFVAQSRARESSRLHPFASAPDVRRRPPFPASRGTSVAGSRRTAPDSPAGVATTRGDALPNRLSTGRPGRRGTWTRARGNDVSFSAHTPSPGHLSRTRIRVPVIRRGVGGSPGNTLGVYHRGWGLGKEDHPKTLPKKPGCCGEARRD